MPCLTPVRSLISGFALATLFATTAQAQVFEIIHPDVEKGQVEVEVLSGVVLEDTDPGEERSA